MRISYAFALVVVLAFALAGCSTLLETPLNTREAYWHHHERAVQAHADWVLKGSFGLRVGRRGWSAGLRWHQVGDLFHIEIYDPLGRTVAEMTGHPGEVTLEDEHGRVYQADSATALMKRVLGWSLPVAGLSYWVRGLPVSRSPVSGLQLDDRGRLIRLKQDGWDVHYEEYNYDAVGARPTRIVMTHGDVHLLLVVNQWNN